MNRKSMMKELKALAEKYGMELHETCLYCGRKDCSDGTDTFMVSFVPENTDAGQNYHGV